ncbi:MAG: DNA repair protein RecN, partial [Rhodocyclaceae bacterium]|nr:DNA repair protein RecN [Rhodocyclaceae bacterium]
AWLAEQDIPVEDGCLLLRRVVEAEGRSRAWINGTSVTLAQLRTLAEWLCDIHGQHAHHALLRPEAQRQLLDTHGGLSELAGEVASHYRGWRQAARARLAAQKDRDASEREREMLAWQLRELEELAFDPAEWLELNQEHGRLAHGARLLEGAEEALVTLGEGDFALASRLDHLVSSLAGMAEFDSQLAPTQELLGSAAIAVGEALHALRRYRDRLDLDPSRLAEVEQRIAAVNGLARKHRLQPEELPELLLATRARLAELTRLSDPESLARAEAQAEAAYRTVAGQLSARRIPVAEALSSAVTEAMQTLAMGGGSFQVALAPQPEGGPEGLETVEFRVAANPSQPLRPLAKVASGGELSRIGLAIQVIASRSAATPTLIFDEVDVGIGGGVAEVVGRLLYQLGSERQVMCVTHLPQVAARADWQWSIAKVRLGEETLSQVTVLDQTGRVEELARMLGGVRITETTRQHAAEMLGVA